MFERRQKRLLSQWSAGMLVGTQDFEVLFANDPGEEAAPLGGQLEQGSDPHQPVVPSTHMGGGAASSSSRTQRQARFQTVAHESYPFTYFANQWGAGRKDYAGRVAANEPIGSGGTEAACKVIVKQRLCGPGMKWTEGGAAVVLSLRTLSYTPGLQTPTFATRTRLAVADPGSIGRVLRKLAEGSRPRDVIANPPASSRGHG